MRSRFICFVDFNFYEGSLLLLYCKESNTIFGIEFMLAAVCE